MNEKYRENQILRAGEIKSLGLDQRTAESQIKNQTHITSL